MPGLPGLRWHPGQEPAFPCGLGHQVALESLLAPRGHRVQPRDSRKAATDVSWGSVPAPALPGPRCPRPSRGTPSAGATARGPTAPLSPQAPAAGAGPRAHPRISRRSCRQRPSLRARGLKPTGIRNEAGPATASAVSGGSPSRRDIVLLAHEGPLEERGRAPDHAAGLPWAKVEAAGPASRGDAT